MPSYFGIWTVFNLDSPFFVTARNCGGKMEAALYLIPVTLGDTEYSKVFPSYNIQIIKEIKHFVVENIKSAKRFLAKIENSHVDDGTFVELSEHTDIKNIQNYLLPLQKGEAIGVISEAGCPAVADPGSDIVALAHKKGFKVVPLVGPNSIIMAIMASGFCGQSFAFNGYLPVKIGERINKIKFFENRVYKEEQTQVFIETPYRNAQLFESFIKSCKPETKLCIAANITADDEYIKTKSIAQWKKEGWPELKKVPAIFALYK